MSSMPLTIFRPVYLALRLILHLNLLILFVIVRGLFLGRYFSIADALSVPAPRRAGHVLLLYLCVALEHLLRGRTILPWSSASSLRRSSYGLDRLLYRLIIWFTFGVIVRVLIEQLDFRLRLSPRSARGTSTGS